MNNVAFGKTMEIVRKQRDSKLLTTKARMNYLVSGSKYHATCFFFKNLQVRNKNNTHINA